MCDDGEVVRFTSPYSPNVFPIQHFFGELKTYIRQVRDEHDDLISADSGRNVSLKWVNVKQVLGVPSVALGSRLMSQCNEV